MAEVSPNVSNRVDGVEEGSCTGGVPVMIGLILGSGGVVGIIQILAFWLRNRSKDQQYTRVLGRFNAIVTFWKTWLEANAATELPSEKLTIAKERAAKQLENLAQAMDELINSAGYKRRIGWIRYLFLFYWPTIHSFQIWLGWFLFYWSLAIQVIGSILLLNWWFITTHFPAGPPAGSAAAFFLSNFDTYIPNPRTALFNVVVLALLRIWVFFVESNASTSELMRHSTSESAIDTLLLFLRGGRKT
jgi:hypothetical protein